ncbi:MAG: hypothetical protein NUV98_05985 [Candidatus Roizmanbacteria bacterium]|nr:hypothetical protein [Candidatus Roizmanbacteria bacterium]
MAYPECELPGYQYCPKISYEEAKTPLLLLVDQLEAEIAEASSSHTTIRLRGNLDDIKDQISYLDTQQNAIASCSDCLFKRLDL